MNMRRLGPDDEPQSPGALVAVNYGDYRTQEVWVRSGAYVGNWYPLGGEFGRPQVWDNPRNELQKIGIRGTLPRPAGTIPLHPHWEDVLARGPVSSLVGADDEAYQRGWRNGRLRLWEDMEDAVYAEPKVVEQ